MEPGTCLTGTCGWREGKAKYFERYSVVELQDTFYDPPSIALARKWRELAPPSFQFSLKAWQLITHTSKSPTYRRLKMKLSAQEQAFVGAFQTTEQVWLAWERTLEIARALRARMIVFQCPKSFLPVRTNIRNLCDFFSRVDREGFLLAWEPRGEWPDTLVRELCSQFHLIHCVDPFDRLPVCGQVVYWRLHGRGGYSYRYSEEDLDDLIGMLGECAFAISKPAYVMFNNVWMRDDAARLQQRLLGLY